MYKINVSGDKLKKQIRIRVVAAVEKSIPRHPKFLRMAYYANW